ncbi:hypothetical protein CCMA1212_001159 [Trichoderma ghanense]|uniref:Uncharacterized protein n=1 Tax=Trichoderma ghanense TaxID=65468 RepID=A0ABY2HJG6_9HYPO
MPLASGNTDAPEQQHVAVEQGTAPLDHNGPTSASSVPMVESASGIPAARQQLQQYGPLREWVLQSPAALQQQHVALEQGTASLDHDGPTPASSAETIVDVPMVDSAPGNSAPHQTSQQHDEDHANTTVDVTSVQPNEESRPYRTRGSSLDITWIMPAESDAVSHQHSAPM